jgi:hypothetical protein
MDHDHEIRSEKTLFIDRGIRGECGFVHRPRTYRDEHFPLPRDRAIHSGPFLTILFEELGVVIRLHSSGRGLVQVDLREEAEKACAILKEETWGDIDHSVNSGK